MVELQYYGANCLTISTKNIRLVVDDNLSQLGLKSITKTDDISLKTTNLVPDSKAKFIIDSPGEYEISGVSINGVAARSHMDKEGDKTATIYTIDVGDLRLAIMGHIFPQLSDGQLEKLGRVDVAVVPVGDSGYTLDGLGALQVIKQIEPKVVIPTHYADKALKYEVPQVELSESLKALGMDQTQPVDKYKPKAQELTDSIQLVILSLQ